MNPDDLICSGIKPNLAEADQFVINKKHLEQLLSEDIKKTLQLMGRLKVAYLDAGSRLIVATKKNSNEPEHSPENLLQALYKNRDKSVESDLENVFKTTFNMKIRFDYSAQIYLIFRVSKQFEHIPEDQRWAYPILKKYPILDTQGDGFRSFVGVVLSILLSENRIILLDEPEAFLHPTQARALGMWIGEQSVQQSGQIFIATHNGHFLSGLLSSGNEVSIYRFNRHDDFTKIHALPARGSNQSVQISSAFQPTYSRLRILQGCRRL